MQTDAASQTNAFSSALHEKVRRYFAVHNLSANGNFLLYLKAVIHLAVAAALYITLVFFTPPAWFAVLLCVLLGLNLAAIGFNTMHEGGHQSFSKYAWLNTVAAYMLNLLGGNQYFWRIKHNVNHHTFTNIEGMDSDIDVKPFMRLHEGQPLKSYHRFQHLYWVFLYGISYLAWVFYEDFVKYFSGRVALNTPVRKLPLKEHLVFWITKIFYVTFYVAIPIAYAGLLPWVVGFFIVTFVCGVCISIVFQLAHVVEGTTFYDSKPGNTKEEWAIQQIRSTANFSTDSKVWHWLLGGLNFQIEHHLFPRVSHIHYPAIRRFIKETCSEYNVTYNEYRSMLEAFISHLAHLRRLGRA